MNPRGQGRLRLALPWLATALESAAAGGLPMARAPAAEWLVARGEACPAPDRSWREWLLTGTDAGPGLLERFPAGPCLRALETGEPPDGTWACARPVHLLTAIDHLQLARGHLAVEADESAALRGDLNRHLDGRGFRFHAANAVDDWQLECAEPVDCSSIPPDDAEGGNLRELMPGGRDGARVSSLMNEIQMLLHDHPVNLEREARGRPTINSLWLWGFGRLRAAATGDLPALYTDDAWLAGAWRLHGTASRPLGEFPAGGPSGGDVLVGWCRPPGGDAGEALAEMERRCCAPSLAALRSGSVRAVDVLAGGRVFETDARARLRFWRRRKPLAELIT